MPQIRSLVGLLFTICSLSSVASAQTTAVEFGYQKVNSAYTTDYMEGDLLRAGANFYYSNTSNEVKYVNFVINIYDAMALAPDGSMSHYVSIQPGQTVALGMQVGLTAVADTGAYGVHAYITESSFAENPPLGLFVESYYFPDQFVEVVE